MDLAKFTARRLALAIVMLFIVATITFFATQGIPGNTAKAILGPNATPSQVRALTGYLGLNHSVWHQYLTWLSGLLHGNLGRSYTTRTSVSSMLGPKIEATLVLGLFAAIIGMALALTIALYSALRPSSLVGRIVVRCAIVFISVPEFVIGLILVVIFATGIFHLLPGVALVNTSAGPTWFLQQWQSLLLPAVALGLVIMPHTMYMLRGTLLQQLHSDYAEYARLVGMSNRRILLRWVLPNVVAPTAQVMALGLAYLFGGVISIEVVFAYPGMGAALVNAVQYKDLAVIQFIVVVATAAYLLLTLGADVIAEASTRKYRRNKPVAYKAGV